MFPNYFREHINCTPKNPQLLVMVPPIHCLPNKGIFSPWLLGVKPVSQTYLEGHLSAYISSHLVADRDTKEALLNGEQREEGWTRKTSTLIQCREVFSEMKEDNECRIPTPENCSTFAVTVRVEKPKILKAAKEKVAKIYKKHSSEAVEAAPFQGEMLSLLEKEGQDISWKASIFQVPRGVMAFAVRAGTNTLATPDNLERWGRPVNKICIMEGCNATCTLGHLLSGCAKSLDRYTFRHDCTCSTPSTRGKGRGEGVFGRERLENQRGTHSAYLIFVNFSTPPHY